MLVPIYVDLGKGWARLGAARIIGNTSVELNDIKLPATPKRVGICALNDVLVAGISTK